MPASGDERVLQTFCPNDGHPSSLGEQSGGSSGPAGAARPSAVRSSLEVETASAGAGGALQARGETARSGIATALGA